MTTSLYNNLAIQMYPQPLNNRPVKRYGAIFRHVREDFIDITTRACMHRETHCMGLNFKSMFLESIKRESRILITKFCQSIKRKPRKQIPPKSGIKMANYFLFGLLSFSRQAEITKVKIKKRLHEFQNLGYINLALAKSSAGCGSLNQVADSYRCSLRFFYVRITPILSMVRRSDGVERLAGFYLTSLPTSLRLIAQFGSCSMRFNKLQVEAVIMTTTPNPIVSTQKLFKFYDLSTAQVIQTTATTEREARKSLGKQSLIFIARIRLTPIIERARTWGGYSHE
ncbi:host cell division inhibitor Icd-like protein [Gilliamella apicola]|uniref:Host cell division inhibitor Icd-like protein n=2 Tax=Gilliamella apicola TaxID=1196095 RepID=A0A556RJY4_9GAMM|nr:host cell division inhibitor Icd-like protein [Gilliamella apicola]